LLGLVPQAKDGPIVAVPPTLTFNQNNVRMGMSSMNLSEKDITRFWKKVNKRPDGIWEWIGTRRRGEHGMFMLNGKATFAHRISWFLIKGKILEGQCVLHKNDVPWDVNPDNLWVGSQLENIADRHKKGRTRAVSGEQQGHAKLTETAVKRIRHLKASTDISYAKLAIQFGVHKSTIKDVVARRQWKHVP
jgi:hypothetical protein